MMELKNNDPNGNSGNKLLALLYVALTCFAGFLLLSVWNQFVSNPTVTSLQSSAYPVANIPFPGVAFCNVNKISRRKATDVARDIADRTGEELEKVMGYVKLLGYFYDGGYDEDYITDFEDFQNVLDTLQVDIRSLMRSLVTPCGEFIQSCSWKGIQVNCSSILHMRLTYEGYCCVFNYIKNTTEWGKSGHNVENLTLQSGISGLTAGLSVTINNEPDDYLYTSLGTMGVKVLVFTPTAYPDKASGALMESMVDMSSESFFQIVPTTLTAVEDVMQFGIEKRGCLFEVEQKTQFGVYSQSDCFVDCRVRSMVALCGCIPFIIPLGDADVCTLTDLSCLSKYQKKWISQFPTGLSFDFVLKEQEDGLFCPKTCYPACEDFSYQVVRSSVPSNDHGMHSYIHLYYGNRFHNLFQQDVVRYWFDLLSSVGGVFGLVLGFSVLSIVEGIIFCGKFVAARW